MTTLKQRMSRKLFFVVLVGVYIIFMIFVPPDSLSATSPVPTPTPTSVPWPYKEAVGQQVWYISECAQLRTFLPEPRQASIFSTCRGYPPQQVDLLPEDWEYLKRIIVEDLPPDWVQED